jgi:hypothetical protein
VRTARFSLLARCCMLLAFCGTVIPLCFADCVGTNKQSSLALKNAPASIQTLAQEIRDKSGDEVEATIVKYLGPGRDVGSGLRILHWDVGKGAVVLNRGLANFQTDGGEVLWLTATSSKALQTISGEGFEMTTPPSPQMKYWLGDLELKTGSIFKFIDSREWESLHHREKQTNNFFLKHPDGRFAIQFAPGCSSDTVLSVWPMRRFFAASRFSRQMAVQKQHTKSLHTRAKDVSDFRERSPNLSF